MADVDTAPKHAHPVMHYCVAARALSELVGSVQPADFSCRELRELVAKTLVAGSSPWEGSLEEPSEWQSARLTPAQQMLALRALSKAEGEAAGAGPAATALPGAGETSASLVESLKDYVNTQKAALDKESKAKSLSFSLQDRIAEVGLEDYPADAMPTEEAMMRWEAHSKVAREKKRAFVGSAEGEDLQKNCKPPWARGPDLGLTLGSGSVQDKARDWDAAKRSNERVDRVDFLGFANFQVRPARAFRGVRGRGRGA